MTNYVLFALNILQAPTSTENRRNRIAESTVFHKNRIIQSTILAKTPQNCITENTLFDKNCTVHNTFFVYLQSKTTSKSPQLHLIFLPTWQKGEGEGKWRRGK